MKSRRIAASRGAKATSRPPASKKKASTRVRKTRGTATPRKRALEVRLELVQELRAKVGRKPPLAASFTTAPKITLARTDTTGPGTVRCRATDTTVTVEGGEALLTRRLKVEVKYEDFARALEALADSMAYRPDWFESLGAKFGFNGETFVRHFLDGGDWLTSSTRGDPFGWIPKGTKVSVKLRLADAHFDPSSATH